jgi:hypothetical protein
MSLEISSPHLTHELFVTNNLDYFSSSMPVICTHRTCQRNSHSLNACCCPIRWALQNFCWIRIVLQWYHYKCQTSPGTGIWPSCFNSSLVARSQPTSPIKSLFSSLLVLLKNLFPHHRSSWASTADEQDGQRSVSRWRGWRCENYWEWNEL